MQSTKGIVLGFLVMVVMFFLIRFGALAVLGEESMFQAGTHDPSQMFIMIEIIGALAAAIVGGLTCSMLAKATRPPITLALAVFVLGIVFVFPAMTMANKQPTMRDSSEPMVTAMSSARRPVWVAMMLPVAGVVGLLAGGAIGSRGVQNSINKKK